MLEGTRITLESGDLHDFFQKMLHLIFGQGSNGVSLVILLFTIGIFLHNGDTCLPGMFEKWQFLVIRTLSKLGMTITQHNLVEPELSNVWIETWVMGNVSHTKTFWTQDPTGKAVRYQEVYAHSALFELNQQTENEFLTCLPIK